MRRLAALFVCAALGCTEAPLDEASDSADGSDSGDPPAPRDCIAPEGMGSPASIEDAVALIDALPKPTSIACLLESLDRPLAITATQSERSAQPAVGAESPRVFITWGAFTMSVVVDGLGAERLEFATDVGAGLSVKGELLFPIEGPLEPSEPYSVISREPGTSCGACHDLEQPWDTVDGVAVFASEALQYPDEDHVSTGYVSALASSCDIEATPQRCEMLTAIFAHGDVETQRLPETMKICRLVE